MGAVMSVGWNEYLSRMAPHVARLRIVHFLDWLGSVKFDAKLIFHHRTSTPEATCPLNDHQRPTNRRELCPQIELKSYPDCRQSVHKSYAYIHAYMHTYLSPHMLNRSDSVKFWLTRGISSICRMEFSPRKPTARFGLMSSMVMEVLRPGSSPLFLFSAFGFIVALLAVIAVVFVLALALRCLRVDLGCQAWLRADSFPRFFLRDGVASTALLLLEGVLGGVVGGCLSLFVEMMILAEAETNRSETSWNTLFLLLCFHCFC
mmetsp:Transcript_4677/g.12220  ORF Transcript_4677/g.12220 Transcript_4677/m.12220 type:complete len:261 (+) Transcript_4677:815-1597(+)